ncbi:hypothetical protein BC938DRAFT_477059 [Jimgerdemannia flammicorona]|uniref:E3 ubiquitin ligase complex SCF subunit n=1 Tax=Jimgerdemannia flammicorona TaxID=994334 RepID=A0A433QPT5_9FUNG|nr:hypothetical protein BC938DRAFT_477059 [Jimgerdemannia flammicorona]
MSDPANITLVTMDGTTFTVPSAYLHRSKLVQDWLRSEGDKQAMEVKHVTPFVLQGVLNFCEIHAEDTSEPLADPADPTKPFEADPRDDAFRGMPDDQLLQFTMAADILQIPELVRLTAQEMASRIDGKSPDQIRAMFNPDDLAEEDVDSDNEMGEVGEEGAISK